MTHSEIIRLRLANQGISHTRFTKPEEVVSYLGAVQAQDYIGAKWALGLRLKGVRDEEIDEAFNQGKILRTHAVRPTWHFVTPDDIRWIVDLNAPQVKRVMAPYNRTLELDEKVFTKSNRIIAKALEGKTLTRPQLQAELEKKGITGTGQRVAHTYMQRTAHRQAVQLRAYR
jgi:hypothetical protein